MKFIIVLALTISPNLVSARSQILDEFSLNDQIEEDKTSLVYKYYYQLNEIENDNMSPPSQFEFSTQEEALGVEHNFTDTLQFQIWLSSSHSFSNRESKRIMNDPFILVWKRVKYPEREIDTTGDFGIEISPSVGSDKLYKSKNGNQLAIKYRFGLYHDTGRIHATYLIGIKEGVSFNHAGLKRKQGSMAFWGISLAGDYRLYKKLSVSALLSAIRKSENQGGVFYPNSPPGPSWETSYGVYLAFEITKQLKTTLGYRFENESSSFYKFSNDLDIEDEQKNYFLSLTQIF